MGTHIPSVTNYSERLVDVELLQSVPAPADEIAVDIANVNRAPKIVAGVEKLAQRYTNLFLQSLGTTQFAPDNGTDFLATIARGVHSRGQIQNAFALANNSVLRQLRNEDNNADFGTPQDDERLANSELLDLDIDTARSWLFLRVLLTTESGDDIVFVIPAKTSR